MNTCPCQDCENIRDFFKRRVWLMEFQNISKKESKNE